MRLIPPLTAIAVTVALFGLIMHREALVSYAGRTTPPQTTEPASTVPNDIASSQKQSDRIGIVALKSYAQPIDNAVILRGQTRALRQVDLRAETTSTVVSEPLRKGAEVKSGDLLCQLDPGTRPASLLEAKARLKEAQARVPQTEAQLDAAHARLHEMQINLTAAQKLTKGGYTSETQLASAQAAERTAQTSIAEATAGLESTQAGIESARAVVAAAQKEMSQLEIRAPFDGILESDTAEIGSLLQPGDLCATVIQLDTIKLVGFVPETQVDRVILGAEAKARLATNVDVAGQVTFISRSADENTRTFEVEITVPNADLRIRDGQTADIQITSPGATAHHLPQSALTLNNDGALGVRIVRSDQTAGFVPVKLLRDTVDGVWLSGLPSTANVIVVGQDFVTSGVALAVTYQEVTQ